LWELERWSENTYHQLVSLKASYDALTTQMTLAEKRVSAAIKQAACVESQLSNTQVSGSCRSDWCIFSIIS
jgi:hypothetical protein